MMRGVQYRLAGMGLPLRVSLARAVLEGLAGFSLVLALAMAIDLDYRRGQLSILGLLGWIWLAVWPAWRLRPLRRRPWWRRIPLGVARVALCSVLLSGLAVALRHLLWPSLMSSSAQGMQVWGATGFAVAWAFLGMRVVTIIGVFLYRRARGRLRWQLTASHLAVILLTFVTMTALGSTAGLALLFFGLSPNGAAMATSIAGTLRVADSVNPLARAPGILSAIQARQIVVSGEPAFAIFSAHARNFFPKRLLVVRPGGMIVASAIDSSLLQELHLPRAGAPLSAGVWSRLSRPALAGRATSFTMTASTVAHGRQTYPTSIIWGAAPILDARRHIVGVAVVEMPDAVVKPNQVLPFALALFGVSTFVVLLSTSVPVLLLSVVFGVFLARGLTRRLEAATRVTTAIAAGDLSQRVHIRAVDESGRLADSVNRMAASLDTAMGELRGARAQAEDALRARQELVASISHELRTPLAIVRAHLDNLSLRQPVIAGTGATAPMQADEVVLPEATLLALRNETQRLAVLIDDLFTLSRAETGALRVTLAPVDVAALVTEVAALMRPLAQNEGQIALTVDARPGLPLALADADRLRQILENLVRNAVRHTPDGGIIALAVAAGERGIIITVADTGEGIAAEHLPHIFERFYRVDQARTRGLGGAGLGLAIAREFVELMGGRVTVESAPGEGSCFQVLLPLATPPAYPSA